MIKKLSFNRPTFLMIIYFYCRIILQKEKKCYFRHIFPSFCSQNLRFLFFNKMNEMLAQFQLKNLVYLNKSKRLINLLFLVQGKMEQKPRRMVFSINKKNIQTSRKSSRSIIKNRQDYLHLGQTMLQSTLVIAQKLPQLNRNIIVRANSAKYSSLTTTCWCLYDQKQNKQLGFRQNYQREVASLTKIMTTIVGLQLKKQFGLSGNLMIRITQNASRNIGTTASLKNKHWIMLKDLFYGIMLPSGNDASYLLAEVIGFMILQSKKDPTFNVVHLHELDLTSENTNLYVTQFVRVMNTKADELGMDLSRFSNPHGLQNAMNISTARDILILSRYATQNTKFREIMNCQMHRYCIYATAEKTKRDVKIWENTNVLLREGWEGVKTGQTVSAGSCLSSLRNGIFIVILNCPDSLKRFTETKRLYNWYLESGKTMNSTESTSTDSFQM